MSQLPANVTSIPNKRQARETIKNDPRLVDETQVRSVVSECLSQLHFLNIIKLLGVEIENADTNE
mgnify:CR=1 FL=1